MELDFLAFKGLFTNHLNSSKIRIINSSLSDPNKIFIIVYFPFIFLHVFKLKLSIRSDFIRITSLIRIEINRRLFESFLANTIPVCPLTMIIPILIAIRRWQLIENNFLFDFISNFDWFS